MATKLLADQRVAVSVVRDLSERKMTEEALNARLKKLTLLQSISQVIQKEDSCEGIFQKIVCAMPNGFYYNEVCRHPVSTGLFCFIESFVGGIYELFRIYRYARFRGTEAC